MVDSVQSIYTKLLRELRSLLDGERDPVANAANTAALLYQHLDAVNWVGFYFAQGDQLVLGPFQGKPACVRIAQGKGVCGSAAAQRKTLVVPDVHAFPGHIACDAASRSEVVVPLCHGDAVIGVLDLDSPVVNRFTTADGEWLEKVAATFQELTDLPLLPRSA